MYRARCPTRFCKTASLVSVFTLCLAQTGCPDHIVVSLSLMITSRRSTPGRLLSVSSILLLFSSPRESRWYSEVPERPVHVARVWKQYSNNPK